MKQSLSPVTKLALIATAVVPTLFALIWLVAPGLADALLAPSPLILPGPWKLYTAAVFLGIAAGAVYALGRDDWPSARGVLVIGAAYNLLAAVATLLIAVSVAGFPRRMWIYVVLAVIYLIVVVTAWRQESARQS